MVISDLEGMSLPCKISTVLLSFGEGRNSVRKILSQGFSLYLVSDKNVTQET